MQGNCLTLQAANSRAHRPQAQSGDCCSGSAPHTGDTACFSSFSHSTTKMDYCLDPIPIMTKDDRPRCSSSSPCVGNSTCLMHSSPNALLRIGVGKDDDSRTVLWSGPPLEVWQQGNSILLAFVHVNSWIAQLRWASSVRERSYTHCGYQSPLRVLCRASSPYLHSQNITDYCKQILKDDNALPVFHESISAFLSGRWSGLAGCNGPSAQGS